MPNARQRIVDMDVPMPELRVWYECCYAISAGLVWVLAVFAPLPPCVVASMEDLWQVALKAYSANCTALGAAFFCTHANYTVSWSSGSAGDTALVAKVVLVLA